MESDHQWDCEGRNDIHSEGEEGARWGQITNATMKGGTTYALKATREHDGVRSLTGLRREEQHTA